MTKFLKLIYYNLLGLYTFIKEKSYITILFSKKSIILHKSRILKINLQTEYDISTFVEIFIKKDYSIPQQKHSLFLTDLIQNIVKKELRPVFIDVGANIGIASIYWNLNYPMLKFITVEMERNNYIKLKKNTSHIKDIKHYNNALSSSVHKYDINTEISGNNSFQIKVGTGNNTTITINNILSELSDTDVPFILKMDIEGYEMTVLENAEWINNFFLIIIEIHDWIHIQNPTSKSLFKILSAGNFNVLTKKNLFFAFNLNYKK